MEDFFFCAVTERSQYKMLFTWTDDLTIANNYKVI